MLSLYLPLVVVCCLAALVPLASVSRWTNVLVSRAALGLFGDYVSGQSPRKRRQRLRLQAAHVPTTHRLYASRTLLYAGLFGVVGSVVGVYALAGVLELLELGEAGVRDALPGAFSFLAAAAELPEISVVELFVLLLASSATVGAGAALGTYWARWQWLDQRASARAAGIEATLPRTVAFVYALAGSGMSFPQVLETLTRNERVYGEAAREIGVAVRDMNTFGTDVLSALRGMARRTPNDRMEEFGENLSSVLGSGRSLSSFLREQYERYQEEAEAQQEQYLELVSTFAEVYVTVLVAGPLFFMTILVVIGLVLSDTLDIVRFIGYVGIPLATLGFVVYIDSLTRSLRTSSEPATTEETVDAGRTVGAGITDGGVVAARWQANRERLAAYDRFEPLRDWVTDPLGTLIQRPAGSFAATVPLGIAWVLGRVDPASSTPGELLVAADGPVVEASIVALGLYAAVYEVKKRRIRRVEQAVPDFLDRLASVNEAGLTVVESLHRVGQTDLGALSPDLRRLRRDIEWGANAETALARFERRVESPMVTRSVTLISNAMRASGDISPVLRIAADEAQGTRRLQQERRQEMVTYLLVIYISFFVFLGIIAALTVSFIPAVEQANVGMGQTNEQLATGFLGTLQSVDTAAYTLVFFHTAVLQGVCSGLVAGQLGEGSVKDGVKHATILLLFTYVAFLFI
jgi:flagellar protein FlaJ